MRTRAHDQGFVDAPPGIVYRSLSDIGAYASWWADAAGGESEGVVRIRLEPRLVTEARPERHREGVGLFLRLGPPYDGTLEWYLERFEDGTVVNVFLDVGLAGRGDGSRRLRRIRSAIRRGLVGLKARLE